MLSSSPLSPSSPATMSTPTRPTVRTVSVPPPLALSQSLSLPLDGGNPTTATPALLSPTHSASFPLPAPSPREPKSPPPPTPPTSALAPPTPIPSYMQATKAFASRSPQPPSTPTRTNSVSSSVVSGGSAASKRTSRSTTRAADRSRSRPRPGKAGASTNTFTPTPDSPALPTLPPPPKPAAQSEPPTATASPPPLPPAPATGEFPCASCRAHYTSTASTAGATAPAWTTAARHPHKLHRHLLDLQITNDTLAVLNADLQATVAQQARFIAQLEEHVARLALKIGKEETGLVAHLHDDQEEHEVGVASQGQGSGSSWYEPVSDDKIQDHHKLLARMCDRTHRMLYDARRAVNRNRGDMESVSVDDDDDDECASVTSVEFDEDDDDEVSEIEADVVPKIVMPAGGARGRQLSTTSSIASSTAPSSTMSSSAGSGAQLHSLVKSLAYHIHLLDSTPPPPPPPADLLSPTSRRTSSSTVSSSRLTARSPSPLSLTRTPSGFGVLGLGAVLDLAPPHHAPAPAPAGSGAAAAARKHQLEQCLVVQRCKDTVMQLCSETGVPMGEVHEMVVDAQMHVATSMPGSPTTATTVTSASRLANPAVASRHPSSYHRAGSDAMDEDMVDIRSDASSTRSNYSRVSSVRSFMSSEGGGARGGAQSSVLGPNASASALGRAGGMVYPAGMSLEDKYRMHMAYQQAAGGTVGGGGARAGSMPRVVLHDDADDETAPPRSLVSGSGSGAGGGTGGAASSSLSSPTLLPDSASVVSGVSGARVVRIKHADAASAVSGGSSSAPSVSGTSASGIGTGTPSRVASVLSGFISPASSRVNGSEVGGRDAATGSPQGSSAGRTRGPGSMVARAIKVRTWMG